MPIDFKIIDGTVPYNQAGLRKSFCCKLNSNKVSNILEISILKNTILARNFLSYY